MINSHNGTSLMKDRRESTTSSARERGKRNRRAFPRWVLDFDVRLSWESHSVTGRGYEIGAGGISLTAEREPPAEDRPRISTPSTHPSERKGGRPPC